MIYLIQPWREKTEEIVSSEETKSVRIAVLAKTPRVINQTSHGIEQGNQQLNDFLISQK